MTGAPLVSVIVPVRDGARFLGEALDSVAGNGYAPVEVVVVDGHSTDGSAEIARAHPLVRYVEQGGRGLADAWNTGLDAARGGLIAFLDSDDVWVPEKLARQVAHLEAHPETAGVVGRVAFFAAPGVSIRERFGRDDLEQPHVAYMPGALLVRRAVVDAIGGFDPSLAVAADNDWFARLKDAGYRLDVLPRLVVRKRVHERNLSLADRHRTRREIVATLRRSIRRQEG